eukprot:NODE_2346_length_952_cov_417.820513.p1 GENE.NODE_2346_length_952_cov_417.820513~~NODE_2346_length_952_cov_417.820513.p1  ORF type:complete len:256 (+),score=44.37 NODE_2346_length_952_cov_417.820513:76-843(+)
MSAIAGNIVLTQAGLASLSGDALRRAEEEFTDAFNQNRALLAGFSKAENALDLACVRDGFHLGMAKALHLPSYKPVEDHIVHDFRVAAAAAAGTNVFETQVAVARQAPGWKVMVGEVMRKAAVVGSDLAGIWKTLAVGRLEWLSATSAAHGLKLILKDALKIDAAKHSEDGALLEGDLSDARMVWMYALGTQLPPCKELATAWAAVACVEKPLEPLHGYNEDLWDPRRPEWAPLDLAIQAAAERAGTSLDEAWSL